VTFEESTTVVFSRELQHPIRRGVYREVAKLLKEKLDLHHPTIESSSLEKNEIHEIQ
jgi:hypothetical protein